MDVEGGVGWMCTIGAGDISCYRGHVFMVVDFLLMRLLYVIMTT